MSISPSGTEYAIHVLIELGAQMIWAWSSNNLWLMGNFFKKIAHQSVAVMAY
jgi:hypothetical protein